jgi:hypothetical protein
MTPKEFQKSNLAVELKAGKKRLEDALRGLSDEQCERTGATRSGSVVDLLSEFGVLRSAIIRRTEGLEPQRAKYAYVADVCVTGFNEQIDAIERWRGSEIVGFSGPRLRAEAREAELNQAIVDLSREDFLAGNFDLKSLFSLLFDRFYTEDLVLWLGAGETNGRTAAFQRMAEVLEPINTLLETGMASIVSFRVAASAQDGEGNFITDWETVLGGTYSTGGAVRWRTVRAWKSRMVIAERIEGLPSAKP